MSKTAIGFGVGADVSYYFSKTVGVGGMIRFARATADVPVNGQPSVGVPAGRLPDRRGAADQVRRAEREDRVMLRVDA